MHEFVLVATDFVDVVTESVDHCMVLLFNLAVGLRVERYDHRLLSPGDRAYYYEQFALDMSAVIR